MKGTTSTALKIGLFHGVALLLDRNCAKRNNEGDETNERRDIKRDIKRDTQRHQARPTPGCAKQRAHCCFVPRENYNR